ncbi:MAG TPA: AarF/UbiB family protein [Ktedonobacteraceae bacterium]|nr:AarF/UbiB family protein [Ktedonobacteraceae bacterium]
MANLKSHVNSDAPLSVKNLIVNRFSRHPERYFEIFGVLRKYELHHIAAQFMNHQHDDDEFSLEELRGEEEEDHAVGLASALEELGPCFIKLGQILSTRPDLLPANYIEALSRLQNTVTPVPGDKITAIIESELGAPISELFESFDCNPLAAASMAQVHHAFLPDGSEVAVKVQRPGARQRIEIDIEILHEVAKFASRFTPYGKRYGFLQIVRELERSLIQELDFRQEAESTRLIGKQISEFKLLTTPTVYSEYTTRRVLTLSFVHGRQLAEVSREELNSLDSRSIAKELLSAYLKQMVIDGVFHCDPHPGNIFLADDGRLALMDFGMVGRFDADQKDKIILLLLAFSERLGERVADTYLDMIEIPKDVDRRAFTQDVSALVSRYHDMSGGRMAIGTALLDLTKLAQSHSTPVPTSMTLLGKAMLNLDGTIRVLSPELDPVQLIRDYMLKVMEKRVLGQISPGRVFAWVIDMKRLFENTPRRTDMIIDKLANDQLTLRLEVDHLDEAVKSVNRAANRLSLSIIVASLILGSKLVVDTLSKTERRSNRKHRR